MTGAVRQPGVRPGFLFAKRGRFFYSQDMKLMVPFLHQETDYTCGPTALRMVLSYFGKHTPENVVMAIAGTSEATGTGRRGMVNALKILGLNTHAHHGATIDEIRFYLDEGFPIIVNYRDFTDNVGHYGVIVGYERDTLFIHDPYAAEGNTQVSVNDFDSHWYGYHSKQFTRFLLVSGDKPLPPYLNEVTP